ncbi:MAG: S41 family peptidase [Sedimentisphaerales bacterium]|nr:S41 family peptidase [Sedimentisphaerales bacterium]
MNRRQMIRFPDLSGYWGCFSMAYFVRFLIVIFLLIGTSTCGNPDVPIYREEASKVSAPGETSLISGSTDIFDKACRFVYEGEFGNAAELLAKHNEEQPNQYSKLAEITKEFTLLEQKRRIAKQQQYEEKLGKLKSLNWGDDVNGVSHLDDDVNDVNSPADVFAVAASLMEYADENQKKEILGLPITTEAVTRAKTEALKYESEGKWLDAYTSCYYWLTVLDEDNEQYRDYADELLERFDIVASFKDSPCETRAERFKKVEPDMFKNAIEVLHSNYVNPKFLDYGKMAIKALDRCRILAEVVKASYKEIQESQNGDVVQTTNPASPDLSGFAEAGGQVLFRPDSNGLNAWTTALNALKEEVSPDASGLGGTISRAKFFEIFDEVLSFNSTTVALPESLVIAHFTEASLAVLDPHTILVWPQQSEDFRKNLTGEFAGIGILITKEKGLLTAASLLPDTPAYHSGLDAGDIIEQVNGEPTKDMTLTCAVKLITGPAGTNVCLTVRTPGEEASRELEITRSKIKVRTIRGWQRQARGAWQYFVDEEQKIGYVRIYDKFAEDTSKELDEVLDNLEAQDMRGLVIDLRYNQGGLLDSAVDIADKFIDKGLIVRTQPRWGIPDYKMARSGPTRRGYPLVVLVNSVSASASEIVAGALQDAKYNRAVIVGERTHGKGSVQTISYRVGGGAMLKYTMGYYHLPSGQPVNSVEDMKKLGRTDWGIKPDVEVKLTSEELRKLLEVQKENDVLVKADHDLESAPLKKHSLEETIRTDPQLAVALLIIRTKLLEQGRVLTACLGESLPPSAGRE